MIDALAQDVRYCHAFAEIPRVRPGGMPVPKREKE